MTETTQYRSEVPNYGEVMSVDEYLEHAKDGSLMDDDGTGRPVKAGKMAIVYIKPSNMGTDIPNDAENIIWFNK